MAEPYRLSLQKLQSVSQHAIAQERALRAAASRRKMLLYGGLGVVAAGIIGYIVYTQTK